MLLLISPCRFDSYWYSMIIYETINHWNCFYGINPWRYIGSDQHNIPNYFGSSKTLKEDIEILGVEFFEKRIIEKFENISNVELRQHESRIQQKLECAKDKTYYNKTNSSHKGFFETELERKERVRKSGLGYKIWYHKKGGKKIMKEKYSIINSKRGKKVKDRSKSSFKSGLENPNGKYSQEQKDKVIEFFENGLTRNEIVNQTGISYGIVKILIRNWKKMK